MNFRMLGKILSFILLLEAGFMLPSVAIALYDKDYNGCVAFLITIGISLLCALGFYFIGKKTKKRGFYAKDGLICVSASWIVMSLVGALPFVISGSIPRYIDALFEIVSGFTTTGASILPAVENLPRSILYWRSFSHWLGGMGVLVFLLAVMSSDGQGDGYTMHLLRAESPGPNVSKLVPKMRETAKILYLLYIVLTILDILFLLFGGMSVFESFCTAFGTAGTGGFGVRNDSIASYSPYIQNVCTVFMLLFGVNFSCYYLLTIGQVKNVLKDEELRAYVGIIFGSAALIAWNLRGFYATFGETLRHTFFQVATIITTTGFATTDFDLWPSFSKGILLFLMMVGASAGSTGGGLKVGRLLLIFKTLRKNIRQVISPRRVEVVRNNGQVVDSQILDNVNAYLAAYVIITILSFLVVSLDGFSVTTNFTAVIACFNNIGPGLEMVGPTGNYGSFGVVSKLVLIVDMLAGRLEIFPILILFSRSTWKKK